MAASLSWERRLKRHVSSSRARAPIEEELSLRRILDGFPSFSLGQEAASGQEKSHGDTNGADADQAKGRYPAGVRIKVVTVRLDDD